MMSEIEARSKAIAALVQAKEQMAVVEEMLSRLDQPHPMMETKERREWRAAVNIDADLRDLIEKVMTNS